MNQQQQKYRIKMLSRSHRGLKLILLTNIRPRFCCCQTRINVNPAWSHPYVSNLSPLETIKYIDILPEHKEKGSRLTDSQR